MRCILIALVATAAVVQAQLGAILELDEGISPRYFLGARPQLAKRQSGSCAANQHSCQDINSPSLCCDNSHYCFVDTSGNPGCCAIGNNCNPTCAQDQYQCNATTTVSGKATTTSACCARPCTASIQYQCASQFGGNCCQLGFACATGSCVSTASAAPTTFVTQVPSGCTTGQLSCAASIGGGCCNNGAVCTSLVTAASTMFLCAMNTSPPSPVPSNVTQVSSGLSSGAKAGIGVGIGLGACIVIGLVTWFCINRRRAARQSQIDQQSEPASGSGIQPMSEGSKRPTGPRGQSDYFGPNAGVGPYTETQAGSGQAALRGVPLEPDAPGDIVPPVEIGDSRNQSALTSPALPTPDIKDVPETPEHRHELP